MLALILPHRHQIRLVQQNIRRHEDGISEEAGGDIIGVLLGLGLELGHAAQLAELGVAAKDPAQLRMLGHMALDEHDVFLRVQSAGDILGQLVHAAAAQSGGILPHGDGVHVHDAVQAVVFVLQSHPIADGAHVGAEGQLAAGLYAAEYPFFLLNGGFHRVISPSEWGGKAHLPPHFHT